MTTVLVLGGGPDAEREVSLASSQAVAGALADAGRHRVEYRVIDGLDGPSLAAMGGDVVFPVLHGPFGEGGGVQALLEQDGRAFVGCRARAARRAMDKMGTKLCAAQAGVPTAPASVVSLGGAEGAVCPLELPVVVKPNGEGSSVGLHLCRTPADWARAHAAARADAAQHPGRAYLVERMIEGREVTVGVIGHEGALEALPIVEIRPASGVYDYQAKYHRTDTRYLVDPDLGPGVGERVRAAGVAAAAAVGVRHLARVDFILTPVGEPMLLEVNTMPGFTATSLYPKAARAAGMDLAGLCARLVGMALDG